MRTIRKVQVYRRVKNTSPILAHVNVYLVATCERSQVNNGCQETRKNLPMSSTS